MNPPTNPSCIDTVNTLREAGCVYAEIEAQLLSDAFHGDELDAMVCRRVSGTPLEQLLGWAEFCGLRILVAPGVFVPRRRTELLVHQAAARNPHTVVDICCGSGAVGTALANIVDGLDLHAADIDPVAVLCARRNVEPVGGQVHEGDLYSTLPQHLRSNVDVIVANAPYVPTSAIGSMPPEARDHEPMVALDGGADGLDVHRRIVVDARVWLAEGGCLLVETSVRQAEHTAAIFADAGFDPTVVHSEELDGTVVVGEIHR
ncbi:putative protein N(5)-glutamine methyltransferase [Rhodococcus sp. G-MC3]|uniref:putative protein N(5)-glutamine methyltransferase n=1 Tax=Rhodococcus sp. G-MC3 TaxID=3046209 RepID=UPI0024BBD43C|nr:putative protein N(5)-glutamine methyltransferase [Rhodococcus sp. G-MC3]MDJ0394585.1 putative protein N(5)-glutamine methyltransferase [Rhodococcus sp. G-MC3]